MIRPRVLVACTSRDDEVKIEEAFPEDGLLHPQVTLLLDIHTHIVRALASNALPF